MSRILCKQCHRPEKACICAFIVSVKNNIKVVVLQHPQEVTQSKGTVSMLSKSLSQCEVIVGEYFDDEAGKSDLEQQAMQALNHVLKSHRCLLLYPSEQAIVIDADFVDTLHTQSPKNLESASHSLLDQNIEQIKPLCLIILDGTWKKAYRMFMLSPILHSLTAVTLPECVANSGQYHIRKVAKKNALSSLEACCFALMLLENGGQLDAITNKKIAVNYQQLLTKFEQFNQFQLSFIPTN